MKPSQFRSSSKYKSKSKSRKQQSRRKRQTRKRRAIRGGDQVFYYLAYESPTKKGYPVFRIVPGIAYDTKGAAVQVNDLLSVNDFMRDESGKIEDYLVALKLNRQNVKVPKKVYVKKHTIKEPMYLPPSASAT